MPSNSPTFRQSMAWLHTWTGLLPGWVMFLVFLFGTTAFFQSEIDGWMRPELHSTQVSLRAIHGAEALLRARGANAESWNLTFPSKRGGTPLLVSWTPKGKDPSAVKEIALDPNSGREIATRDTEGGWFLYKFHYDLHYIPEILASYIVAIATLSMLLAIISGVITHKKIFSDFFTLRFGKGQRSWLDAHNVTAVVALPFHLMITYSGIILLMFTIMPWPTTGLFQSEEVFFASAYPHLDIEPAGLSAPLLSLEELLTLGEKASGGSDFQSVSIENPNDANALVSLSPNVDRLNSEPGTFYLHGVTGDVLQLPRERGPASKTTRVMVDLHFGLFADPMLRWLYFLSGVGGTVMIATGLVLWTVKRRGKLPDPARPHLGFMLVERLNIGIIGGATAAIAAYFLANRILPIAMPNRAEWEINSLFIVWSAFFIWSIGRLPQRAWIEVLAAGSALYALVPIVSVVTTKRGLFPSVMSRDWVFAGFDLTMLVIAAALALSAWTVATNKPRAARHSKARARAAIAA